MDWKCDLDRDKRVRLNRRPFNPGLMFVWTSQSRIFINLSIQNEEYAEKFNFAKNLILLWDVTRYTEKTLFRILSKLFPY